MAKYIIVHGAFQGGWVWREVARRLAGFGHEVHTPTLTGCGHHFRQGANPADLNTYIKDMVDYIRLEDLKDLVLVGHSYSGLICGAVLDQCADAISKTVWVDCLLPQAGRSFLDIAGPGFKDMLDKHESGNGMIKPWPRPTFGIQPEKEEWFFSRLREFPRAAFTTPVPGEFSPNSRPATFINCQRTPSPFIQRMLESAEGFGWEIRKLDTGHFPMVTQPEELAGLLNEAA